MSNAYLVGAARTPIGTFGKSFRRYSAVELAASAMKGAVERACMPQDSIDEVFFGNVLAAGMGQNPARQAMLAASISKEVPATTINMVCASGMKSIALAGESIQMGSNSVVMAGGTENMSNAPYLLPDMRWGRAIGDASVRDSLTVDGLWCALGNEHMGMTADHLAKVMGVSRRRQDEYALLSHRRAIEAIDEGRLEEEIVEVTMDDGTEVAVDEHPRRNSTLEKIESLKPAFTKEGTVTAGNASGINDGAAAVLVASDRMVRDNGLKVMAEIVAQISIGVEPRLMGTGPVAAVQALMKRVPYELSDIDLFEINEAFSCQLLHTVDALHLDIERVNVNGGAIALGHPIGASGARIIATLAYEMNRRNVELGLASLCVGGGQGMAMLLRRT